MKTKIFVIVMLTLALAGSVHAALPAILVENVDPQPAEPGRDITIETVFWNKLTAQTNDFSVTIDASSPIIFKSSSKDISRLNVCDNCKDRVVFYFTVAPGAASGTYPIYIKAMQAGNEVKEQVDIKVGGKPNLIVSTDSEGLNQITPGSEISVLIGITNTGSGLARQVEIQPNSQNFVVLGGLVKTISQIGVGEKKEIILDLVANSEIEANSYTIPLTVSYLDDQGNKINTTQNLGVKVVNRGEISVQSIKIAPTAGGTAITQGMPFTIVARLENVGTGDANFITAYTSCPFTDRKKSFLGQLKKDDDAPAVFEMTSPGSGKQTCTIEVTFRDDTGEHTTSDTFDVDVSPAPFPFGIVIFIIIVAVLGYMFRHKLPLHKRK